MALEYIPAGFGFSVAGALCSRGGGERLLLLIFILINWQGLSLEGGIAEPHLDMGGALQEPLV